MGQETQAEGGRSQTPGEGSGAEAMDPRATLHLTRLPPAGPPRSPAPAPPAAVTAAENGENGKDSEHGEDRSADVPGAPDPAVPPAGEPEAAPTTADEPEAEAHTTPAPETPDVQPGGRPVAVDGTSGEGTPDGSESGSPAIAPDLDAEVTEPAEPLEEPENEPVRELSATPAEEAGSELSTETGEEASAESADTAPAHAQPLTAPDVMTPAEPSEPVESEEPAEPAEAVTAPGPEGVTAPEPDGVAAHAPEGAAAWSAARPPVTVAQPLPAEQPGPAAGPLPTPHAEPHPSGHSQPPSQPQPPAQAQPPAQLQPGAQPQPAPAPPAPVTAQSPTPPPPVVPSPAPPAAAATTPPAPGAPATAPTAATAPVNAQAAPAAAAHKAPPAPTPAHPQPPTAPAAGTTQAPPVAHATPPVTHPTAPPAPAAPTAPGPYQAGPPVSGPPATTTGTVQTQRGATHISLPTPHSVPTVDPRLAIALGRPQHGESVARRTGRSLRRLTHTDVAKTEQARLGVQLQSPVSSGRIIAVTSIRGGVGKTTVAALLGQAFNRYRHDPVLTLEADAALGTLPVRMGAESVRWSAVELVQLMYPGMQLTDLTGYLVPVSDGGWLLPASQGRVGAPLDVRTYFQVTQALRKYFAVTVVDCETLPGEVARTAMDTAHARVVVAPMTAEGVNSTRVVLDWLAALPRSALTSTVVALTAHSPDATLDGEAAVAHLRESGVPVVPVPYDRHLAQGGPIRSAMLAESTRDAAVRLGAEVMLRAAAAR